MNKHKILYIIFSSAVTDTSSGVGLKVLNKAKAIINNGYEIDVVTFSDKNEERLIDGINFITIKREAVKNTYFNEITVYNYLFSLLSKWVTENNNKYDWFYFRYPGASLSLLNFCKLFRNKIVFEHNTIELDEFVLVAKQKAKQIKIRLRPSILAYYLEVRYNRIIAERVFFKSISKYALAGIAVTNEIKNYEENRAANTYKCFVVSNGISFPENLKNPNQFVATSIKLVMLLGYDADWHGVKRIVESLKMYTGVTKIEIDIVGKINPDLYPFINNDHAALRFLDSVPHHSLSDFVSNYNAGLGTMAAYLKNIHEASPLKVRDYLVNGLPVIIGYDDTDITNNQALKKFSLQFPNNSTPIDFCRVVDFLNTVKANSNHRTEIFDISKQQIDVDLKMKYLLNKIQNIL